MCDTMEEEAAAAFDGNLLYNDIPCRDWADVATLGIPDGSEECDILRVAAVQSCGCPVPALYATQTCTLCPEGEAPRSNEQTTSENIMAVMCGDLEQVPAVDGDRTCDLVAKLAPQCDCQPISEKDEEEVPTGLESSESSNNLVSGASQLEWTLLSLVMGAIASVFI